MIEDIPRLIVSALIKAWKYIMSLRASGTTFDPEIGEKEADGFPVEISVYPGNDEVVFDKVTVPGCDIASAEMSITDLSSRDVSYIGFTTKKVSTFSKDSLPIFLKVHPKIRDESPVTLHLFIKPRKEMKSVKISISGGWLNKLTARRSILS